MLWIRTDCMISALGGGEEDYAKEGNILISFKGFSSGLLRHLFIFSHQPNKKFTSQIFQPSLDSSTVTQPPEIIKW